MIKAIVFVVIVCVAFSYGWISTKPRGMRRKWKRNPKRHMYWG